MREGETYYLHCFKPLSLCAHSQSFLDLVVNITFSSGQFIARSPRLL